MQVFVGVLTLQATTPAVVLDNFTAKYIQSLEMVKIASGWTLVGVGLIFMLMVRRWSGGADAFCIL